MLHAIDNTSIYKHKLLILIEICFAVRPNYFARSAKFFAVRAKDLPVTARLSGMADPDFAIGAGFPGESYLTVPLGFTPYSSL